MHAMHAERCGRYAKSGFFTAARRTAGADTRKTTLASLAAHVGWSEGHV